MSLVYRYSPSNQLQTTTFGNKNMLFSLLVLLTSLVCMFVFMFVCVCLSDCVHEVWLYIPDNVLVQCQWPSILWNPFPELLVYILKTIKSQLNYVFNGFMATEDSNCEHFANGIFVHSGISCSTVHGRHCATSLFMMSQTFSTTDCRHCSVQPFEAILRNCADFNFFVLLLL